MNTFYDFIVIGAGISACTFAKTINNRCSGASLLLIEHGRRIGGRSTTRKSTRNKILEFDHGLPSFSLNQNISQDIFTLISPIIKSKKLIDITENIFIVNEFSEIDHINSDVKFYRGFPYMINFCEEIIKQSINPNQINFLFQTFAKTITRKKNFWEVKINNDMIIRSSKLIISSSLIVHPRCLKILNVNSLPLRNALIKGEDEIVDTIIKEICKQEYIKRKNYILYVKNYEIVEKFSHDYLQIYFSKGLINNFNFEKIVFQRQLDGSMIIVLHCLYIKELLDISMDQIIKSLRIIFRDQKKYLTLFSHAKLIGIMNWRASQPLNNLLPIELQWSSRNNIGFCGDWFDIDSCVGAEAAMNSSIRLAKLLS